LSNGSIRWSHRGPDGAFMALPVAALISSFISNYRTPHEVVYESTYAGADDTGPAADDESASSQT